MSDDSKIEWTDATWNPVRGCSRVSDGCRHCYAERVAARFSGPGMPYEGLIKFGKPSSVRDPRWSGEVRMVPEHLAAPLRWRRPRRVFVNSMSDLFHESLPDSAIDRVFAVMMVSSLHATRGGHTFQSLTKRAKRMREYLTDPGTQERVARAAGTMTFPSAFMLVAAMNPTPDGTMPAESGCSPKQIQAYLGRISGPLLDRIDLHVEVPQVKFNEIMAKRTGETSAAIRERVVAARERQQARFSDKPRVTCNARMGSREIEAHCRLEESTMDLLKYAMSDMNLSARAYDRILKVARTMADLAGAEAIGSEHVSEAIQYRSLDRQIWG